MRKIKFITEEYYHIYNRGIDKREVFSDDENYKRFLICLREFNREDAIGSLYEKNFKDGLLGTRSPIGDLVPKSESIVEIVAYCLNQNHYHLILKQLSEKGISRFMQKVSTGYTTYFNLKNERSGSLFQGPFKAVHIDSNEYLLYLSTYVNANHFIHGYANKGTESPIGDSVPSAAIGDLVPAALETWQYSSFPDYARKRNGALCNTEIILNQFSNVEDYCNFVKEHALQMREKKEMGKYLIEEK